LPLNFFTENIQFDLKQKLKIKKWITLSVKEENSLMGNVNFIFTDNVSILEINKKYLGHNYFTDVITFDYSEKNKISGDVYISIDKIKENSLLYSSIFEDELRRVIIHGILHLLKYDDKTPEDRVIMASKEDFYLQKYN
jgi:probable rRNA maturation factor